MVKISLSNFTFSINDNCVYIATSFGVKINALEKNIKFNQYLDRMHQIIMQRILSPHLRYDTIFRLTKLYQEEKFVRGQCEKFSADLIAQRQASLSGRLVDNNNNVEKVLKSESSVHDSFNILVDQLMHVSKSDGKYYTKEEIRDNVNLFISAVSWVVRPFSDLFCFKNKKFIITPHVRTR